MSGWGYCCACYLGLIFKVAHYPRPAIRTGCANERSSGSVRGAVDTTGTATETRYPLGGPLVTCSHAVDNDDTIKAINSFSSSPAEAERLDLYHGALQRNSQLRSSMVSMSDLFLQFCCNDRHLQFTTRCRALKVWSAQFKSCRRKYEQRR
jgi:hypothetical protein